MRNFRGARLLLAGRLQLRAGVLCLSQSLLPVVVAIQKRDLSGVLTVQRPQRRFADAWMPTILICPVDLSLNIRIRSLDLLQTLPP